MEFYPSESWKCISDYFSKTLCREKKILCTKGREYMKTWKRKADGTNLVDYNSLELRMRVTQMRKEISLDK